MPKPKSASNGVVFYVTSQYAPTPLLRHSIGRPAPLAINTI